MRDIHFHLFNSPFFCWANDLTCRTARPLTVIAIRDSEVVWLTTCHVCCPSEVTSHFFFFKSAVLSVVITFQFQLKRRLKRRKKTFYWVPCYETPPVLKRRSKIQSDCLAVNLLSKYFKWVSIMFHEPECDCNRQGDNRDNFWVAVWQKGITVKVAL